LSFTFLSYFVSSYKEEEEEEEEEETVKEVEHGPQDALICEKRKETAVSLISPSTTCNIDP
jgi:hypothetical protein